MCFSPFVSTYHILGTRFVSTYQFLGPSLFQLTIFQVQCMFQVTIFWRQGLFQLTIFWGQLARENVIKIQIWRRKRQKQTNQYTFLAHWGAPFNISKVFQMWDDPFNVQNLLTSGLFYPKTFFLPKTYCIIMNQQKNPFFRDLQFGLF